jgi:hypothetical protein
LLVCHLLSRTTMLIDYKVAKLATSRRDTNQISPPFILPSCNNFGPD